ncbi:MAG: hypothetical protein R3C44_20400 [Chloroflexota bacterium]
MLQESDAAAAIAAEFTDAWRALSLIRFIPRPIRDCGLLIYCPQPLCLVRPQVGVHDPHPGNSQPFSRVAHPAQSLVE